MDPKESAAGQKTEPPVVFQEAERFAWTKALRTLDVPPTAKLVGLMLSTFWNREKRAAWPSQATLADACGLSVETVRRAIRTLEAAGFLRTVRTGTSRGDTSLYHLTTPLAAEGSSRADSPRGRGELPSPMTDEQSKNRDGAGPSAAARP